MPEQRHLTLEEIRRHLYSAVICDALDAIGLTEQSPRVDFAVRRIGKPLVGRCHTTLWEDTAQADPRPYELELSAVDHCTPDCVFIAAAGGSMRSGVWGELLTTAARRRGCVGAIVDGAVRDIARIREMDFGLVARGTTPYDSKNRQRVIDADVPVKIGGVVFNPGDLVLADEDGMVVIPRSIEQDVLSAAWEKVHSENEVREAIAQGMSAVEAYDRFGVL